MRDWMHTHRKDSNPRSLHEQCHLLAGKHCRLSVRYAMLSSDTHLKAKRVMRMLTKEEIIAAIGPEQYQAACAAARKAAQGTGSRQQQIFFDSQLPYTIENLVWGEWYDNPEARHDDAQKVELILQIYQGMPCYSLICGIAMRYKDFSAGAKKVFWNHTRALLSQDDVALADPLAYSIWCDYFETSDYVAEAWDELTQNHPSEKILQQVLLASGPVPFHLKEELYQSLIHDTSWHYYIFRSLLYSRFDYFGMTSIPKARELLKQLDLPAETEDLSLLRETLEQDEDVPEELQTKAKHAYGINNKLIFPDKDNTTR
jgi:hypothetical protein